MVLLGADIFAIAPEKIRDVRFLKTFLGGRLVFDAAAVDHR
jgi:predicted amidohydrolase YtcJ